MDERYRVRTSPCPRPVFGRWRILRPILALLLTLQLLGLSGAVALAMPPPTSIVVTTIGDTFDAGTCATVGLGDLPGPDNEVTLREAICVSNNTAGDETITFGGITGTISPADELLITGGLTILGAGAANMTISGGNAHRVFDITGGGTVAISDLTLGNGLNSEGGGLYVSGSTVTLTNVVLTENRSTMHGGGAYLSTGSLTLVSSVVGGNSAASRGGGIYNDAGTLDLQSTTVQSNSSDDFTGGIYNYSGTLTLSNCDVQSNTAANGVGGISNVLGSATLTTVTISRNNAPIGPGGGIANNGTLALNGSMVSYNSAAGDGGGLYNTGTLTGDQSAFYQNSASGNGAGIYNTGSLTLTGGSISNNMAGGDGGGLHNHAGTVSLTGVTLEYNEAGVAAGRVAPAQLSGQGGAIFSTTLVPTGLANGTPVVALALTNATIAHNQASEGGGIAIESGTASIQDSTITENEAATIGGGVANFGQLTILTSTIGLNHAGSSGGGIFTNGPLSVSGSTIEGNSADQGGGGIEIYGDTVTVLGSTINGNTATERGGGINNISGSLTAANTTISGNRTDGPGGGIASNTCATTLTFVTITGNHADYDGTGAGGDGGGLYFEQPELRVACVAMTVESSIVAGNYDDSTTVMFTADCDGPLVSNGNNVFMVGGGCPIGPDDATYTTGFDTVLDLTLADNGGPTKTHALPPGSIAIDFGDDTACAASPVDGQDQRGTTRPQGSGCDSGAYELAEEVTTVTLTIVVTGQGTVQVSPPPVQNSVAVQSSQTYQYPVGTVVTLTATPDTGQLFVRWIVDGATQPPYGNGWANPLTITLGADHTVSATFVTRTTFSDVPTGDVAYTPITELAARGIVRGYDQRGCAALGVAYPCYGADDLTERAQVATFIARLLGVDDEDHGNGGFTDLAGLPPDMQRAVGTLAHYGIMIGYGDGRFGPFNKITHTETILVISRAVVLEGDWTRATQDDPAIYPNLNLIPAARLDLVTFVQNAGNLPGFANDTPRAPVDQPAPREWTAQALWLALNAYFGTDAPGKGGYVP